MKVSISFASRLQLKLKFVYRKSLPPTTANIVPRILIAHDIPQHHGEVMTLYGHLAESIEVIRMIELPPNH